MLEVEDFLCCDGIATHSGGAVKEGGHEVVAVAILIVIDGELGVHLQHAVHRGTDGDIAQSDVGCMVEQHVAMDAAKTPEVLVFEVGAVAILIHLDSYLILTFLDIRRDVKLGGFHRAL